MTLREKFRTWLMANRTSARLAFLLRVLTMALGAVLSVLWASLLLQVIGAAVMGNWILFQRALRFAGLGDFGLSGALAVRAGQMIGRGEEEKLRSFLASARSALLLVGVLIGVVFCALSSWLPGWLRMEPIPGSGSLGMLFLIGGLTLTGAILCGYFSSLNAAYATVTWPILPLFFLGQSVLLGQWLVARTGAPLWMQALIPLTVLVLQGILFWWMLRAAHPWLGEIWPLGRDPKLWRELGGASGWIYLYSLGNVIFTATDSFLINAGSGSDFGPAAVTRFQYNYRLVEIAMQVIGSASFIGQSKINLWIHSSEPELRGRARIAMKRLCIFQSWLGVSAALGYLAVNNLFVRLIFGAEMLVPAAWQWMFALNLAVTMGGDASIQIAGLCGRNGLRTAGLAIGLTGVLNFALSFVAMKFGSVSGIAAATVLAQIILSLVLGWYTCHHLQMSVVPWLFRSCLLPILVVLVGATFQHCIGSMTWTDAGILFAVFVPLMTGQAWLVGVNREFIRHELSILRSFIPQ